MVRTPASQKERLRSGGEEVRTQASRCLSRAETSLVHSETQELRGCGRSAAWQGRPLRLVWPVWLCEREPRSEVHCRPGDGGGQQAGAGGRCSSCTCSAPSPSPSLSLHLPSNALPWRQTEYQNGSPGEWGAPGRGQPTTPGGSPSRVSGPSCVFPHGWCGLWLWLGFRLDGKAPDLLGGLRDTHELRLPGNRP